MVEPKDSPDSPEQPPRTIAKKRDRAKYLASQLKRTVVDSFHSDGEDDELFEDRAFDPQRVLESREPEPSFGRKLGQGLKFAASSVANPKSASRINYTRTAARKIANYPYSRATEVDGDLVVAHDILGAKPDDDDADAEVHRVQKERDDLRSGWILGRHVIRVRAIPDFVARPTLNNSTTGQQFLADATLWATQADASGYVDDIELPPFDLREFALILERFAAITTPWQSFAVSVHDVYCWKAPRCTAAIMTVYWILWYFQHLTTSLLGAVIIMTVRNKFRRTTIDDIRSRVQRSLNEAGKARTWGEIIQKHGQSEWIEPLFDDLGPPIQLCLNDWTVYLERLENCYRWVRPRRTWQTIVLLLCGFLFSLLSTMTMFIRAVSFAGGCFFFFGLPIAIHYPKYRSCVNPADWLVWGVPDSAELAIDQLQERVSTKDRSHRERAKCDQSVGFDASQGDRQLKFDVVLLNVHETITLTLKRGSISFDKENGHLLSAPYSALLEMRKIDVGTESSRFTRSMHIGKWLEKTANVQLLPDGLAFVFRNETGSTPTVPNKSSHAGIQPDSPNTPIVLSIVLSRGERDRIFTVILAWSNMRWQPLYSINRQNKLAAQHNNGGVNHQLDDAVKRALS